MVITNPKRAVRTLVKTKLTGKPLRQPNRLIFKLPEIKTVFYENQKAKEVFGSPLEMMAWWNLQPEVTFSEVIHAMSPLAQTRGYWSEEAIEAKLNDPRTRIGRGLIEKSYGVGAYAWIMGAFNMSKAVQKGTSSAAMILRGLEPLDLTNWHIGKNSTKVKEIEKAIKTLEGSPGNLQEIACSLLPELLRASQKELEDVNRQAAGNNSRRHLRKIRKAESKLIGETTQKALELAEAI